MKTLDYISDHRQYYIRCETCNEIIDCRNLSQVLEHLHQNISHSIFVSSRKIPEPVEYLNGKLEIVQN